MVFTYNMLAIQNASYNEHIAGKYHSVNVGVKSKLIKIRKNGKSTLTNKHI